MPEHLYDQVREAIDLTIAAFDDGKVTWVESGLIGRAAYNAANPFAEAMRGSEEHFATLLGEVNRAIDDAFLLLDKPGTDADADIPWVPETIEEAGFAFLCNLAKQGAAKKLTARRMQLLESA